MDNKYKKIKLLDTKQVIVMRKDLNMRKGKIAAQAAHASLAVFFERMNHPYFIDEEEAAQSEYYDKPCYQYIADLTPAMHHWKENSFTKVCVYVNSEEELREVLENAEKAGLPTSLITDNGTTEFGGVKTVTCGAIGPAKVEDIDPITGHLPLY
jgi:PTH2 family peptidyl-tRNA hydrolase